MDQQPRTLVLSLQVAGLLLPRMCSQKTLSTPRWLAPLLLSPMLPTAPAGVCCYRTPRTRESRFVNRGSSPGTASYCRDDLGFAPFLLSYRCLCCCSRQKRIPASASDRALLPQLCSMILSKPPFLHLQNGDNSTYLPYGWKEGMHGECSAGAWHMVSVR